jgi:hypothetical protein
MFFWDNKRRYVTIKMRDEWGVLHDVEVGKTQDTPTLTDQELADELEVSKITVITHRRD